MRIKFHNLPVRGSKQKRAIVGGSSYYFTGEQSCFPCRSFPVLETVNHSSSSVTRKPIGFFPGGSGGSSNP